MTASDFQRQALTNTWVHPETLVVIADEDMPDELLTDLELARRRFAAAWQTVADTVTEALRPVVEWAVRAAEDMSAFFRAVVDALVAWTRRAVWTETPERSARHAAYHRRTRRRSRRRNR